MHACMLLLSLCTLFALSSLHACRLLVGEGAARYAQQCGLSICTDAEDLKQVCVGVGVGEWVLVKGGGGSEH